MSRFASLWIPALPRGRSGFRRGEVSTADDIPLKLFAGHLISKGGIAIVKNPLPSRIVSLLRRSPLFIVFEGIDGSGKTTQAKMLAHRLAQTGVPVLLTAEPSDSSAGLAIKSMKTRLSADEEARLFTEDRRHHVKQVIEPALNGGRTVICDRYIYSSAAYQGARGIDPQAIISTNSEFAPPADVTFLLEISVEDALARIGSKRPKGFSPFERQEDLMAVDIIYRGLDDPLLHRLEGANAANQVHEMILQILVYVIQKRAAQMFR